MADPPLVDAPHDLRDAPLRNAKLRRHLHLSPAIDAHRGINLQVPLAGRTTSVSGDSIESRLAIMVGLLVGCMSIAKCTEFAGVHVAQFAQQLARINNSTAHNSRPARLLRHTDQRHKATPQPLAHQTIALTFFENAPPVTVRSQCYTKYTSVTSPDVGFRSAPHWAREYVAVRCANILLEDKSGSAHKHCTGKYLLIVSP